MKDKQQKPDYIREERTAIHFNCPAVIRDELKRIAEEEDRNLGMQVVHALREWLRDRERSDG